MKAFRWYGRILPIFAVAGLSACAGPVPNSLAVAAHETIVTAVPQSGGSAAVPTDQQMLDLARGFVLRVRNVDCALLGTAFVAASYLFTNRHVIAGATRVELSAWDGHDFTASVLGHGGDVDLAQLDPTVLRGDSPALIGGPEPVPGDLVYVAGYPEGDQLTVSSGSVLGTIPGSRVGMTGQILLMSNQVEPGNSGSPVLNTQGQVVGVVFGLALKTHYALAIPVSSLSDFITAPLVTSRLSCAETRTTQPSLSG